MPIDDAGNQYEVVSNVRLTYVSHRSRESAKDWAEEDVLRIQAYKGGSEALHMGPEISLDSPNTILEVIEALCRLYTGRPTQV